MFVGCGEDNTITMAGQTDLCEREPDAIVCVNQAVTNNEFNYSYFVSTANQMYSNFIYTTDIDQYGVYEYWTYNTAIDTLLVGDCEDVAMTYIYQLIQDGVSADNIYMIYGANNNGSNYGHYYVRVILDNNKIYEFNKLDSYTDAGFMRMDYVGSFTKY